MRCPSCGYVSFDHLDACKECGANLQEERQRRGVPVFTAAPLLSPPRPISPQPASSAPMSQQEVKGRLQEIDKLLAGRSDLINPALMSRPAAPEKPTLLLPPDVAAPPYHPPGRGLPPLGSWDRASEQVGVAAKAGFWIRLVAWIADIVCLFLATIALAVLVLTTIWFGGRLGGEINDQVMALAGYSSAIIVMASGFLYFTLFVGSRGQTPGKMLFGLRIVRVNGQEMTYGRACLRSLCWILSLLLFSVGFLMIAFTRQKQGLHDMLAGTYVVRNARPL
jgi:uncharacterized RDD family membrane protein YckC